MTKKEFVDYLYGEKSRYEAHAKDLLSGNKPAPQNKEEEAREIRWDQEGRSAQETAILIDHVIDLFLKVDA